MTPATPDEASVEHPAALASFSSPMGDLPSSSLLSQYRNHHCHLRSPEAPTFGDLKKDTQNTQQTTGRTKRRKERENDLDHQEEGRGRAPDRNEQAEKQDCPHHQQVSHGGAVGTPRQERAAPFPKVWVMQVHRKLTLVDESWVYLNYGEEPNSLLPLHLTLNKLPPPYSLRLPLGGRGRKTDRQNHVWRH